MTKEQLELAKECESDIILINQALNVLTKPMLQVYSKLTGSEFDLNDFSSDTCVLLKTAMRETLEARKHELEEKIERI